MILVTSAVHGFGMGAAVRVVWLDDDGRVVGFDELVPGAMRRHSGARFALEVPIDAPVPDVGSRVRLVEAAAGPEPILGTWPGPSSSVARRSAT